LLLRTLTQNFPANPEPSANNAASVERSRLRYEEALERLRAAGIPTRVDPDVGAREYVRLRVVWQPGVEALASALGFRIEDVDRAASSRRPHAPPS